MNPTTKYHHRYIQFHSMYKENWTKDMVTQCDPSLLEGYFVDSWQIKDGGKDSYPRVDITTYVVLKKAVEPKVEEPTEHVGRTIRIT